MLYYTRRSDLVSLLLVICLAVSDKQRTFAAYYYYNDNGFAIIYP